ncbi:MAG TPA: glycosyltransferase family 1 protein [Anaerolineae bacterium]
MVVELVSRPATTPSGLSRYADTLARYLQMEDIPFHRRPTEMPGYLRPLARVGKIAGYDLPTFFENYPVGGQFSGNALYHLTSESLASLLVFQSLKPSVVTVHGFFSYLLRNVPELRVYQHIFHQWFDKLVVWGLSRADHLICVSHYLKNVLVEQMGIPPAKVTVIYEAVDHESFYPAPVADSFYARFGLSHDHRYVLYVGSEQPRKNFLTLLRAFARLRQRMPDLYLLKVGQAEYEQERQKALQLIDELGLRESVLFMGHVSGELPDFYRLADAFVFPSLYEGFGFPPLEAMACGTPVVSSNTSSLPEVVGDAALLFNPLDEEELLAALARLLCDEALQQEYRRRGLENARRFQWEAVAQQTVEVYRHVFEGETVSLDARGGKGG